MSDLIIRFLIGGVFVSAFAVLGDSLQPKSFAGLFGAAPSVALATLVLTIHREGANYAAIEGHSMIFGAIAFCCYAYAVYLVTMRWKLSGALTAGALIVFWLGIALGLGATRLL